MSNNRSERSSRAVLVGLAIVALEAPAVFAQSGKFDLGLRANIVTAGGVPANDIIGFGLFGHYRLSDRWLVSFGLDQSEYDFERPARVFKLDQDPRVPDIDTTTEATTISAGIEREYSRPEGRTRWFWGAGVGFAAVDVADIQGPLAGGGRFDITTDPGSEFLALLAAGARWRFGSHLVGEFALRVDHHFADWAVVERVSGRRESVDDYTGLGGHFGLLWRF
jgi:hypothetical protein